MSTAHINVTEANHDEGTAAKVRLGPHHLHERVCSQHGCKVRVAPYQGLGVISQDCFRITIRAARSRPDRGFDMLFLKLLAAVKLQDKFGANNRQKVRRQLNNRPARADD